MQNIQDIRQDYFMQCKKLISELLYAEDAESLLQNKFKVNELYEKISFLKVLNDSPEFFQPQDIHSPQNVEITADENNEVAISEDDEIFEEVEEEPLFVAEPETEINAEQEPETVKPAEEITFENEEDEILDVEENHPGQYSFENNNETAAETLEEEKINEELIAEAALSEGAYQKSAEEAEREQKESKEGRRKIIEFEHQHPVETPKENYFEDSAFHDEKHHDKKLKLAHIKGLKSVQSLFDEDPLENVEVTGILIKANVPTDFMEAQKAKPEFKLDLNDKIAFSKMLFGGSQTELNETVNTLNNFRTLEEAKEYLSDLYYRKHWKKADEFAQRLWILVENKFL